MFHLAILTIACFDYMYQHAITRMLLNCYIRCTFARWYLHWLCYSFHISCVKTHADVHMRTMNWERGNTQRTKEKPCSTCSSVLCRFLCSQLAQWIWTTNYPTFLLSCYMQVHLDIPSARDLVDEWQHIPFVLCSTAVYDVSGLRVCFLYNNMTLLMFLSFIPKLLMLFHTSFSEGLPYPPNAEA